MARLRNLPRTSNRHDDPAIGKLHGKLDEANAAVDTIARESPRWLGEHAFDLIVALRSRVVDFAKTDWAKRPVRDYGNAPPLLELIRRLTQVTSRLDVEAGIRELGDALASWPMEDRPRIATQLLLSLGHLGVSDVAPLLHGFGAAAGLPISPTWPFVALLPNDAEILDPDAAHYVVRSPQFANFQSSLQRTVTDAIAQLEREPDAVLAASQVTRFLTQYLRAFRHTGGSLSAHLPTLGGILARGARHLDAEAWTSLLSSVDVLDPHPFRTWLPHLKDVDPDAAADLVGKIDGLALSPAIAQEARCWLRVATRDFATLLAVERRDAKSWQSERWAAFALAGMGRTEDALEIVRRADAYADWSRTKLLGQLLEKKDPVEAVRVQRLPSVVTVDAVREVAAAFGISPQAVLGARLDARTQSEDVLPLFEAAVALGMEDEAVRLASELDGAASYATRYGSERPAFAARLVLAFAERQLTHWRSERNPNAIHARYRTDEVAKSINVALEKGLAWARASATEQPWRTALDAWMATIPPGGLEEAIRLQGVVPPATTPNEKDRSLLTSLEALFGADDVASGDEDAT